jgi:hypothetical protein
MGKLLIDQPRCGIADLQRPTIGLTRLLPIFFRRDHLRRGPHARKPRNSLVGQRFHGKYKFLLRAQVITAWLRLRLLLRRWTQLVGE